MTIKLRYKHLHTNQSTLLITIVKDAAIDMNSTSNDFRFAASVDGYGMLLPESELRGKLNYDKVLNLAKGAKAGDNEGYRSEFIRLVKMTQLLSH